MNQVPPNAAGTRSTRKNTAPKSVVFKNVSLGVAGVISSIAIPLLVMYFSHAEKTKEINRGFVELAIKILSQPATDEQKSLRMWAISLINHYSEVQLPIDAIAALQVQPIVTGKLSGCGPVGDAVSDAQTRENRLKNRTVPPL